MVWVTWGDCEVWVMWGDVVYGGVGDIWGDLMCGVGDMGD